MYISIIYTSFYIYTYIQSKSKKLAALGGKFYLYCATLVWCFFNIFEILKFFLVFQWLKKIREPFFLKIKSSEKQKCLYKLFLSKFKIFLKIESKNNRKFAIF